MSKVLFSYSLAHVSLILVLNCWKWTFLVLIGVAVGLLVPQIGSYLKEKLLHPQIILQSPNFAFDNETQNEELFKRQSE